MLSIFLWQLSSCSTRALLRLSNSAILWVSLNGSFASKLSSSLIFKFCRARNAFCESRLRSFLLSEAADARSDPPGFRVAMVDKRDVEGSDDKV